ncbi:hypothetical protein KEF29_29605 [Streptomyces tuirus]|uniref:Uncharacterized protein n=1 Tax=Streptomyces tuirus TaxID=68278 RepID=A0A941FKQ1_9ACTN|nr:hypothetical protein [Streptomyces tuirus]
MVDVLYVLGGDGRPASARDIAARMNLSHKSVAGVAGFLIHSGLFQPGRGAWALTEAGAALARLRATDSARARLHLRDLWQGSWFQQRAGQRLAAGPLEEKELANHLRAGLQGQAERGVFLVEWMVYALLLERDESGDLRLPADQVPPPEVDAQPAGPPGIFDPLLNTSAAEITALPDDEFIALMGAYRTVFAALAPKIPRQQGA